MAIRSAYIIEPKPVEDRRGSFARTWCRDEFADHGLTRPFDQCGASHNHKRGTLRGLHYQAAPFEEAKLVRCTAGASFDVIVDIRPGSPTEGTWVGVDLTPSNRRMVYIPEGCAHGFQALADDTEIFYQIAGRYRAEEARGIRWDDPDLAIDWPVADPILSQRDQTLPLWAEIEKIETDQLCTTMAT